MMTIAQKIGNDSKRITLNKLASSRLPPQPSAAYI
jgi:hypothetical protein